MSLYMKISVHSYQNKRQNNYACCFIEGSIAVTTQDGSLLLSLWALLLWLFFWVRHSVCDGSGLQLSKSHWAAFILSQFWPPNHRCKSASLLYLWPNTWNTAWQNNQHFTVLPFVWSRVNIKSERDRMRFRRAGPARFLHTVHSQAWERGSTHTAAPSLSALL